MFEQILQKLKDSRDKNSQITDETLTALAQTYAVVVTTEEGVASLDAKVALENIQQNINSIAAAVAKPTQPVPPPKPAQLPTPIAVTDTPEYQALLKKFEGLETTVTTMQNDAVAANLALVTERRKHSYKDLLKNLPSERQEDLLADYETMSFTDDAAFTAFCDRKKPLIEKEVQALVAQGYRIPLPGHADPGDSEGKEPDIIQAARQAVKPQS